MKREMEKIIENAMEFILRSKTSFYSNIEHLVMVCAFFHSRRFAYLAQSRKNQ